MSSNTEREDNESEREEREENESQRIRWFNSKTDLCLWITRLMTIGFTFLYLFSISSSTSYQRSLLSSAATSALRLHQRLPPFRLSREYFALLVVEDSAHYLLYALLFVTSSPVSLALLPIFLFALLHWSSSTLQIVPQNSSYGRVLSNLVQKYQRNILQTVALTEVMLMPSLVICVLSGIVSLLTPFLYFRFLSLRYSSRRNPYSRQICYELRVGTESLLQHQRCPQIVRRFGETAIRLVSRLA